MHNTETNVVETGDREAAAPGRHGAFVIRVGPTTATPERASRGATIPCADALELADTTNRHAAVVFVDTFIAPITGISSRV